MSSQALAWFVVSPSIYLLLGERFRLTQPIGSISFSCSDRRALYTTEGEARNSSPTIRACDLQAAMPLCLEPFLVWILGNQTAILRLYTDYIPREAKSTSELGCGYAHSAFRGTLSRLTTRTSPQMRSRLSCILPTRPSSTSFRDPLLALLSSYMSWMRARKRTASQH